jgi:ankyrin repeat protein
VVPANDAVEQLQRAVHGDDAEAVRRLLERVPELKAKINDPSGPFDSPAIINAKSAAMVDALLAAGADINARSRWWAGGFGILDCAELELAAHAIARGAVVDIHAAAHLGMLARVQELIAADPACVHARGGDGQTPLHFARAIDIAAYLMEHGADIDARDVDHESTPAQYMVDQRQDVARFLVERGCTTDILMTAALGDVRRVRRHLGADPGCIRRRVTDEFFPMIGPHSGGTIYQWTLGAYVSPHQVARKFGHEDVYALLMEHSPPEVLLLEACWRGDEAAASALAANQPGLASTLLPGDQRQVADAARNNETAVVHCMLKVGLPVDARGQHSATPMHWAAFHGNRAMIEEILRFHPPLEATDADFGGTPLGWAVYGSEHGWSRNAPDHAAVVQVLIQAGAHLPKQINGTEAVRAVLRGAGVPGRPE